MTLYTDSIFLTNEIEGFRACREKRSTAVNTMTALFCEQGYIDVWYHNAMLRINAGELFLRIPDFSYQLGPFEMSPDFKFYQVTVDARVYEKVMYEHMRIEPDWYAKQEYVKAHPTFKFNEASKEFFLVYFHLLTLQLKDRQTEYRRQIIMLIARGAAMEMLNYMDKLALVTPSSGGRVSVNHSDYTFREFTRILQQYPHEREVQWYASKLGITPKYLSEICKERSGKSASEWIADITVTEIKHYLTHTTMPIHEVARIMEFPNASFFCQYTKKHTGLTPNRLRKQKKEA